MKTEDTFGITVDGKPLEDHLREEEDDRKKGEAIEDFHRSGSKRTFYHQPIGKIKVKDRSGRTRRLTQAEINREYWRKNMEGLTNINQAIMVLLLSGGKYTTREMAPHLSKKFPDDTHRLGTTHIAARMRAIYQSPLGRLLVRENISASNKPIYRWRFIEHALNMKPEELFGLYNRKDPEITYDSLAEKYDWLKQMMDGGLLIKKESKQKPLVTDPAKANQVQQWTDLQTAIKEGIEKTLGVNVRVEGSIKILFGFTSE